MTTTKKITAATFKSFVKKNRANLMLKTSAAFDPMIDGSRQCADKFAPVKDAENNHGKYNLGLAGVWLVGNSRDYFTAYEKDGFTGIEVYNSCGRFTVAIAKA